MIFNFGNQNSNLSNLDDVTTYSAHAQGISNISLTLPAGKYLLAISGAGQAVHAGVMSFTGATVQNVNQNQYVHTTMTTATVKLEEETVIGATISGNACSYYSFNAIKID